MGLFGPSQKEMTDAVRDGIQQTNKVEHFKDYRIKVGAYKIPNGSKKLVIPVQLEATVYSPNEEPVPELQTKEIFEDVNDIIYDVVEVKWTTEYNIFTNTTKESRPIERNVARYYQHNGWNENYISDIINLSTLVGYWVGDMVNEIGVHPKDQQEWREFRMRFRG